MNEYSADQFWMQIYHPIELGVRTTGGTREYFLGETVVPTHIATNFNIEGAIVPARCTSSKVFRTAPQMSGGIGVWPEAEIVRGIFHEGPDDLLSQIAGISKPNPTYLFSNRERAGSYTADSHLVFGAVPADTRASRELISQNFLVPLEQRGFTRLDFDSVGLRVLFVGRSHRLD